MKSCGFTFILVILIHMNVYQCSDLINTSQYDQCYDFNPECFIDENFKAVRCANFPDFSLSTFHLPCCYIFYTMNALYIDPPAPTVLTNQQLGWTEMLTIMQTVNTYKLYHTYDYNHAASLSYTLNFYNLKGFDLNLFTPTTGVPNQVVNGYYIPQLINQSTVTTKFVDYGLNFYLNGTQVWPNSSAVCNDSKLVSAYEKYGYNIFNMFGELSFMETKYSATNVCPFIFKNANISYLRYSGCTPISFDMTPYSNIKQINSVIDQLSISGVYKMDLTQKFLHPQVFKETISLQIYWASVNTIQKDIFSELNNLKNFDINLNNLRNFLHMNQIEWLKSINEAIDVDLADETRFNSDSINQDTIAYVLFWNHLNDDSKPSDYFPYFNYDFPDQDFCLFVDYPHRQLVITLVAGQLNNCSCTLASIYRYIPTIIKKLGASSMWDIYDELNKNINCSHLFNHDMDSVCNFAERTRLCNVSQASNDYSPGYFVIYDLKNEIKELYKILIKYIGPVVSGFSLLTNSLVIATCLYSHYKLLKNPLFKNIKVINLKEPLNRYILLNGIFNVVYSLTFLLFYSIPCIPQSYYNLSTTLGCYEEGIVIKVISSIVKLPCNLSLIQISLNRYILVKNSTEGFLYNLSQQKTRKFIIISLSIGLIFGYLAYLKESIFSIQELRQPAYIISEDFYNNYYNWDHYNNIENNTEKGFIATKISELPLWLGLNFFGSFVNFLLICFTTTILDVLAVIQLTKMLEEKQAKISSDRKEDFKKKSTRSTVLILLNSLINFVFRLPDLLTNLVFSFVLVGSQGHYIFKNLCFSYRQCLNFVNLGNSSYIFSQSMSFFFLLGLNKAFVRSFKGIFGKKDNKNIQTK